MPSFVGDGFTLPGYIKPYTPKADEPGDGGDLHDELHFTYRPSARSENIRYIADVERVAKEMESNPKTDPCALEMVGCKFVAERVSSWSLVDHRKNAVKVSAENCLDMNGHLFGRLLRIIQGSERPDTPPEESEPKTKTDLQGN